MASRGPLAAYGVCSFLAASAARRRPTPCHCGLFASIPGAERPANIVVLLIIELKHQGFILNSLILLNLFGANWVTLVFK
jgi:hypothetical protein